jgi:dsRNA-specific ribonuclease
VSNENLAKAALEKGLDFYIMTAGEKERKWRPLLVSDNAQPESRQLSKKVLADVVEALIGACFVESGFQRAFECINRFIPEVRHTQPQFINPVEGLQSGYIESLKAEELIGYHFKRKEVLIEALTHPSCNVDIRIQSYQRLEFLGDAVLDMLIAEDLMERRPEFTPKQMTQVKHCLVNSDLLGFICLNYQMVRDEGFQINPSCGVYKAEPIAGFIQIWKYMHSQSPAVIDLQRECLKRFEHHHKEILEELEGSRFPWARLAQFGPEKFYSDIIESIIGAIFVDSGGDLEPCRRFIDRIELTRVAKYIIEGDVDVTHPKNALQQLVHSSKVDYTVEHGEEPGQLKCKVLIDGCEITEIQGYLKRDAAITVAAESALNVIAKG